MKFSVAILALMIAAVHNLLAVDYKEGVIADNDLLYVVEGGKSFINYECVASDGKKENTHKVIFELRNLTKNYTVAEYDAITGSHVMDGEMNKYISIGFGFIGLQKIDEKLDGFYFYLNYTCRNFTKTIYNNFTQLKPFMVVRKPKLSCEQQVSDFNKGVNIKCMVTSHPFFGVNVLADVAPNSYNTLYEYGTPDNDTMLSNVTISFYPNADQLDTSIKISSYPILKTKNVFERYVNMTNGIDLKINIKTNDMFTCDDIIAKDGRFTINCKKHSLKKATIQVGLTPKLANLTIENKIFGQVNDFYSISFDASNSLIGKEITVQAKFGYNSIITLSKKVLQPKMKPFHLTFSVTNNKGKLPPFDCSDIGQVFNFSCSAQSLDPITNIKIYSPGSKLYQVNGVVVNNDIDVIKEQGYWSCTVDNEHGQSIVRTFFILEDIPCNTILNVIGTRITSEAEVIVIDTKTPFGFNCETLTHLKPIVYILKRQNITILNSQQPKLLIPQEEMISSQYECTVFNSRGHSTSSIVNVAFLAKRGIIRSERTEIFFIGLLSVLSTLLLSLLVLVCFREREIVRINKLYS